MTREFFSNEIIKYFIVFLNTLENYFIEKRHNHGVKEQYSLENCGIQLGVEAGFGVGQVGAVILELEASNYS